MHEKLSQNFPDLVITSVLGSQDEFLNEFIKVRQKRGTPQFIWVGASSKLDKLKTVQRQLIDANLPTPIQPDILIQTVCKLFQMDPGEYLQKYRSMLSGHNSNDMIKVTGSVKGLESFSDPIRADKYKKFLDTVPKLDRVFSLKEIDKHLRSDEAVANTPDLFEKKKNFIKALFKK